MGEEAMTYDAAHIEVLEGPEAIRKRPGMYVGSTGERGMRQLVFDVMDRAVHGVLTGHATEVDVTLCAGGVVRVADDGPGTPVEAAGHPGGPGLEALLTQMYAGTAPFGRDSAILGAFGMGPCVTNALSSRLTAEVRRGGVRWLQEYAYGVPVSPLTPAGPATGSGTTITFRPDAGIFGTARFSYTALADRFRELAFLNRGLSISLADERAEGGSRSARFCFPDGARDFVTFLDAQAGARSPLHPDVIGFEGEDPRMAGTVEVAVRWHESGEKQVRGFANSHPTLAGGTHVEGFRDGLAAAVGAYARGHGLPPSAGAGHGIGPGIEGLTAIVSVKLDHPEYRGATRGLLGNTVVRACVAEAVREHLGTWLEANPEQAAGIVGRIVQGLSGK